MDWVRIMIGSACLIVWGPGPVAAEAPQELPGGWRLIWNDEFDGDSLDLSKWTPEDAALVKNNEKQYYSPEQVSVSDGMLTLTSIRKERGGRPYLSGLVETRGKFARAFGRYEVRAKLPTGKGLWPAHWLMPDDNSWPPEIDIMELIGHYPDKVHMTHHFRGPDGRVHRHGEVYVGPDFTEDFHTYAVEWEPDALRWYVDGVLRYTSTRDIPNVPMRIILNTAVGGDWPGDPNKNTVFPQLHVIDYVRVYTRTPKNIDFVSADTEVTRVDA